MIQIYVEELSTYNNGIAYGKWISVENFDSELALLLEEATEVLKEHGYYSGYPAEEFEIVDYETDYDLDLSSIYTNISQLKELNEILENVENYQIGIIGFLLDMGYDISQIEQKIDEVRVYHSWDEAIDEFIEYFLEISEDSTAHSYLDYEKIQRDLDIEGYTEYNGQVFYDI